ncbi:hypothetical protein KSF_089240 [Reticulibacter mediterranei]|uniref:TIR domain-containing protein n=1 Tax=Reticulibacter mediterranei TaxID=2778369 RepID=A0A8J3IQG1_9CHLR|nr:toll/interleukin-1 receptor domain-containing protein [Reticulibacter mediterranei]GHO98876.1 hypothetical protein KSF_089240 [Reticulibacter mediterranei]
MTCKQNYQQRELFLNSMATMLFRIGGLLLFVHSVAGITVIICISNHLTPAPSWPWLWIELKVLVYLLGPILCFQSLMVICTHHLRFQHLKYSLLILTGSVGAFLCALNLSAWYASAAFPFLCLTYIAQWMFQARLPALPQKRRRNQSEGVNAKGNRQGKLSSSLRQRRKLQAPEAVVSLHQTAQDQNLPPQCIIWYESQTDGKFARQLLKHLQPAVRQEAIRLWDIGDIQPGDLWEARRTQAIQSAAVAVLLISADFLNNERIACQELPQLLYRAQTQRTLILRLQVSPCDLTRTGLERFHPINTQDKSLAKLGRAAREEILSQTAHIIRQRLGHCL